MDVFCRVFTMRMIVIRYGTSRKHTVGFNGIHLHGPQSCILLDATGLLVGSNLMSTYHTLQRVREAML